MSSAAANNTSATVSVDGEEEIEVELPNIFRVYKDGRFVRFTATEKLPACLDPSTGVESKDVTIDRTTGISARLYLPPVAADRKLPVLVYFHGGAFCLESAASPIYHRHLNTLASVTPLIAVSVDYRLAPEHPLPAAYNDSWAALRWVFSLSDPWLARHAELARLFIAGDSAGANISHHMALRAREAREGGVFIKGVALIHPYFWGSEPVGSESTDPGFRECLDKIWRFLCPSTTGSDDPKVNPFADDAPSLATLACDRVLVTVAEKDIVMKNRGRAYFEKLKECEWGGDAEFVETPDAVHDFHIFHPDSKQAKDKIMLLADFFNKE